MVGSWRWGVGVEASFWAPFCIGSVLRGVSTGRVGGSFCLGRMLMQSSRAATQVNLNSTCFLDQVMEDEALFRCATARVDFANALRNPEY